MKWIVWVGPSDDKLLYLTIVECETRDAALITAQLMFDDEDPDSSPIQPGDKILVTPCAPNLLPEIGESSQIYRLRTEHRQENLS